MKLRAVMVGAVALALFGAVANADEIKLDINSIVIDAGGAFNGTTHTGTLQLSMDADSNMFGIQINNGSNLIAGNPLTNFTGTIDLVNGVVTGGSFTVTAGADTYTAMIVANSGDVDTQALPGGAQGFTIDGLTFQGFFSSNSFAGVNVTPWFSAQPLIGSFINLFYDPDANGVDSGADIDIVAITSVVPLPAAAGMGLVGMFGIAGRRRRHA